jgi:hypothetical protein
MEASFTAAQARARAGGEGAPVTSEEEIETLADEAIRRTRRDARDYSKRKMSHR